MGKKFLGDFNPDDTELIVNKMLGSGFGDGTFIKVSFDEPARWKKHVGAKGEVSRTKNCNTSGTITVSLKWNSPFRVYLDKLKYSPGVFEISVKNNNYFAHSSEAWIDNDPDVALADEEQVLEYIFGCADLTSNFR